MHAHEHDHGHEHDESLASPKRTGPDEQAELPHLLRAAATGRTEVLGPSGMSTLQRTVGNSAVRAAIQRDAERGEESEGRSSVHDVVASGGGEPLDTDTRGDMEARLGADFGDVRVHTGSAAHESAKEVGAHAYTVGNNVVFQRDAYDPSSHQGSTTLAHELTHVIQQRSGPVDGTEAPGGIRVSDPSDRFEQEASANAERVMAEPSPAPAPAPAPAAAAPSTAAPPVQRQEADEDEEPADVQGSFVQRAAESGTEDEEEAPPEG
ncbi:eCIS core domain-containing protein [Streptomyces antimycoticus]|uniref:eCIS core domain-containing protein n=1 Tax=Streptomyces antimycoticus TaxID=68175 RepID=UPI003815766C